MLRCLPDNVSDAHGALAEPLAVALHAIRVSAAEPDEIDSTGHPSGAPLALRLLAPAGRLTVVGLPDDPAALDLSLTACYHPGVR
jgi:threonine dehydrogenase-like Zn-dependent dehydrogenase